MVFSGMVSEARKIVQESEDRAQGLEQLAQDVYKQACVRIEELVNVAKKMYQSKSNCNQAPSLHLLTEEVQATKMKLQEPIYQHRMLAEQMARQKVQLSDQVHQNRVLATETESVKSQVHNLFGHKGWHHSSFEPFVWSHPEFVT